MNSVAELPDGAVAELEKRLLVLPQLDIPLVNRFAPGVYVREVTMPEGAFVIGHEHKTEHFNFVLSGRASVLMEGKVSQIEGPCIFVSGAGVRKVLYIHEEMRWATIHATTETDQDKLDDLLVTKSDAFLTHQEMLRIDELKGQTWLG